MVNIASIRQWNARFASEHHKGRVGVFTGATGGIGAGTLTRMVQNLHDSTFYVLGRSEARFAPQKARLVELNPSNKIVFLSAQVSLLGDIDAACEHIKAAEDKVDFVYMSPGTDMGTALLRGPQYTSEHLEQTFVLSYYARLRLVANLLPLLRRSPHHPRVLSVLNGGREEAITTDDLGLEQPGAWSILRVGAHTTAMTSLAFEHLAAATNTENGGAITFLHTFPGLVKTDLITRMKAPAVGLGARAALAIFHGVGAVVMGLFGTEVQDCGDRQAYLLTMPTTAAATSKIHPGAAWRIDAASEVVTSEGMLRRYREMGLGRRVWEFTEGVFARCGREATTTKSVEG